MDFTTLTIPGTDAVRVLNEYRPRYSETGQFPFLIGNDEDFERLKDGSQFNEKDPAEIVRASLDFNIDRWLAARQSEAEEYEFSIVETLGEWPGENPNKGSICLHTDLKGKFKPKVILGLATIDEPWQLPAMLKYGGWNDCPDPGIHCAIHRRWQERYGAEITGMSSDVVECAVKIPPTNQSDALRFSAWEQYWYCSDIVEQGCDSVSNLAATLMNSPYWFFWWD